MTTCASLSRDYCPKCCKSPDATTLHANGACVHCKTPVRYDVIPDRPEEAFDFSVKTLRGAAERRRARKVAASASRKSAPKRGKNFGSI